MTTHYFHLRQEPFDLILSGKKTIEARLYDEKRQKITPGDLIVFRLDGDDERQLTVCVVGLLRYASFTDMFAHQSPEKFGGTSAGQLAEGMAAYYSAEQQAQYGVLGIEVRPYHDWDKAYASGGDYSHIIDGVVQDIVAQAKVSAGAASEYNTYYTEEDQAHYGVLAIEITPL